jgi:hypothetical protein
MSAVVLMSHQCVSMSQSVQFVLPKLQFLFASLPWLVLLAPHHEYLRPEKETSVTCLTGLTSWRLIWLLSSVLAVIVVANVDVFVSRSVCLLIEMRFSLVSRLPCLMPLPPSVQLLVSSLVDFLGCSCCLSLVCVLSVCSFQVFELLS